MNQFVWNEEELDISTNSILPSKSVNILPLWTKILTLTYILWAVCSDIICVWRRSLTLTCDPPPPSQVSDERYAQLQPWTNHAERRRQEVQQRPQRDEGETYLLWWDPHTETTHAWRICSLFLLLVVWAPELPNKVMSLHFDLLIHRMFLLRKHEELAILSFRCPASMSLHPQHASVCLWMFSLLLFLSSMLKVNPSSSLCDAHHQCDFFLYSMHPLHPSLHTTSLPTMPPPPSSIHPSLHPIMHQTSPPILPLETTSCVWELIDAPVCLDSL